MFTVIVNWYSMNQGREKLGSVEKGPGNGGDEEVKFSALLSFVIKWSSSSNFKLTTETYVITIFVASYEVF